MLACRRSAQVRRCGRDRFYAVLNPSLDECTEACSAERFDAHLRALDFVRWHPDALSGPGEPRQALSLALRCLCEEDPRLIRAALEAAAALLLRHHRGLRDCLFEMLMSAFHLLASPAASVRHKALSMTLVHAKL